MDKTPKVLRLLKSLYCLKQAPKTFFDKLKGGFIERNFIQSEVDQCLFMKGDLICLVNIDDTILAGPNMDDINKEIAGLGVSDEDQVHRFQLRDEGQVGDFLGIRIEKLGPRNFNLNQSGLINKVHSASKMEACNPFPTPSSTVPL